MQHKDHSAGRTNGSSMIEFGPTLAAHGRRGRRRMATASRVPEMQLRRILVLAERFQSLCALKSDPARLIDLLRSLIACSREVFVGDARERAAGGELCPPTADQARCLVDLELLVQGLVHGTPQASRGLAHAMDALLIQCVVFEAAARHDVIEGTLPVE